MTVTELSKTMHPSISNGFQNRVTSLVNHVVGELFTISLIYGPGYTEEISKILRASLEEQEPRYAAELARQNSVPADSYGQSPLENRRGYSKPFRVWMPPKTEANTDDQT